jgi:hypothetical protein
VVGSLVQDEGGPGAGGLDVLDEVDLVDGFPDAGAERVDFRGADLGKPAERGLRVGERGLPQRMQPTEEPSLDVLWPRVDVDGEVEEISERESAGWGWLQHVDPFEDEDVGPLHGLPLPGKDVVGQVRIDRRANLSHAGPHLLDEAQQSPAVIRLGEALLHQSAQKMLITAHASENHTMLLPVLNGSEISLAKNPLYRM